MNERLPDNPSPPENLNIFVAEAERIMTRIREIDRMLAVMDEMFVGIVKDKSEISRLRLIDTDTRDVELEGNIEVLASLVEEKKLSLIKMKSDIEAELVTLRDRQTQVQNLIIAKGISGEPRN